MLSPRLKLPIALLAAFVFVGCSTVSADYYEQGHVAYERGDYATALKEWKQGAEQGDPKSQYELGLSYAKGEGAPRDDAEAVKWYRKAAEQGEGASQNNLGLMYSEGRGVPKDDTEAAKWYYRAARHGSLAGIFHLALSYEKGRGVSQDYNIAAITYLEAAKRGYAPAQANVGLLYTKDVSGVPQDYSLAYKWISLAIPNLRGETKARFIQHRDNIVTHLSPVEREKLDLIVREWKPSEVVTE
jgi:TPR repeat protein